MNIGVCRRYLPGRGGLDPHGVSLQIGDGKREASG